MARKILVVDDEPDIVHTSKSRLEDIGYQVVTAANGLEALDKVRSEKPNLIILDIRMPLLDGFEMFNRLREDKEHKDIPVIMVTASKDSESMKKGMDLGAVTYLTKPFNMDVLLGLVNTLLSGQTST